MDNRLRILKVYYLLTPVFLAIELLFDFNIRITIPGESAAFKYIYYAVCFLCAFFVFNNPLTASVFSLVESVFNLFLLILSVMYPVSHVAASVGNANMNNYQFALSDLFHFLLVGSILLYAFYTNPLIAGPKKFRF